MNKARRITLFALALLVVAFVACSVTIPSSVYDRPQWPASLFANGLTSRPVNGLRDHHPDVLERRIRLGFGGAATVVILVGLALGAGRRGTDR
jgi:hypothetical protein